VSKSTIISSVSKSFIDQYEEVGNILLFKYTEAVWKVLAGNLSLIFTLKRCTESCWYSLWSLNIVATIKSEVTWDNELLYIKSFQRSSKQGGYIVWVSAEKYLVSNLDAVVNSIKFECLSINPSLGIEELAHPATVLVTFSSMSFELLLLKDWLDSYEPVNHNPPPELVPL
jgi:hypothetical protein